MEPYLIRGEYKMVQVLYAEPDYAALCAVDIQDREKPQVLLNVYEGSCLRRFIRAYDKIKKCPALKRVFIEKESLVAVFPFEQGQGIDSVFQRGAELDWKFRLSAASDLMEQALRMADYPPEVICPMLLSEQVRVFPQERRLALQWLIHPMEETLNGREAALLLNDQLRKLLLRRWDSPMAERKFLRELASGRQSTVLEMYACWKKACPELRAEYEKMDSMLAVGRFLRLLRVNFKDALQRMKEERRKGAM